MSLAMADYAQRRTMMVDTQVRPSDVTKFPIIAAMLSVAREKYVPASLREAAYIGGNLALDDGRVLLEARSFAKMLDALDIGPTDVVLDIGCGLGYSSAVIAQMAEFVVAVEDDEALATEAQTNLSESGIDNAAVVQAPLAQGAAKSGPYDVVILQGAAEQVPQTIIDQIKEGGRIGCIFADGDLGTVRIGRKNAGKMSWHFSFNASAPVLPGFEHEKAFAF